MKIIRCFIVALLSLMLIFSASGCSPDHEDAYIYFELNTIPKTLDPQLVESRDETVIVRSIFDTLLRYNENGDLVPSAAESYKKDGLTYTFTIRDDISWRENDKLSAYDFEFAFKRALSPETDAPAIASLSSVSKFSAIDEKNFSVTLKYEDKGFLNTLTTPITMPCNEKYFRECGGKYGLTIETTPSCSSYYIRKWTTDDKFLIRLAKNLDYKGTFEARNMRVYFTCDKRDNAEMLKAENTDLAFVEGEKLKELTAGGISLFATEDTTYFLLLSPNLNKDIRSALIKSVKISDDLYSDFSGITVSNTVMPSALNSELGPFSTKYPYDISSAAELYSNTVLANSSLSLKGMTVKCYSNPAAVATAKNIVAHWQQNLGAFMNIEETSSLSTLESLYFTDKYTAIIMPIRADFCQTPIYLSRFKGGVNSAESLQKTLGESSLGYPLYNESTYTAATGKITNFGKINMSGVPDVALAEKHE